MMMTTTMMIMMTFLFCNRRFCLRIIRVLSKYVKVSASHFRKDYLFIKREKGKTHRKKIMEKSERKTIVQIIMKENFADKSGEKKVSHLKLHAGVINNKEYFNDSKIHTTGARMLSGCLSDSGARGRGSIYTSAGLCP